MRIMITDGAVWGTDRLGNRQAGVETDRFVE